MISMVVGLLQRLVDAAEQTRDNSAQMKVELGNVRVELVALNTRIGTLTEAIGDGALSLPPLRAELHDVKETASLIRTAVEAIEAA